ncbi:MAG: bifunctional hydroxymethylpyrimidine kinase/phosphomethylpyrimidine kinase [Bacteroidales bacterium]|nr:bifunctional hydroxymethylpyrimidine kinase/phosphomethylpyrimidine kinase [Bacteroidales bacterium]
MKYHTVLSIAGSDSGGGAGIQADIKSIEACGCYASSAITAITVQNTLGVTDVFPIPVAYIEGQAMAVLNDIGADAIKIGMLHSAQVIEGIERVLIHYHSQRSETHPNVVLDPVMVSTSGHRLMEETAIQSLKDRLLPRARVITPNIPEAEILLGGASLQRQSELPDAARRLADQYQVSVLLKAGHLTEEKLVDIFYDAEEEQLYELPSVRIHTRNTHGTGCTMSSALASMLAHGLSLPDAAAAAKDYINRAIVAGADYEIGQGFGPVHLFFRFWK